MLNSSGIYKIQNWINGKMYIGSASYMRKRCNDHLNRLLKGNHPNQHLQKAWSKYGAKAFTFNVVEYCSKEILIAREQYFIDLNNSSNLEKGYNIARIAGSTAGIKAKPESILKRKITIELSGGFNHSEETKANISNGMKGITNRLGTRHSDETRSKMSKSHGGRKLSEQAKQKLKDYHKSKGFRKNKNVSFWNNVTTVINGE